MLTAKDIMTTSPVTVTPKTDIGHAAALLLEHHFNGLPVIDSAGTLVGILCQSDLVSQQKRLKLPSVFTLLDSFLPLSSINTLENEIRRMTAVTVANVMTPTPVAITPATSLEDIATLMANRKLHTLPVVDAGKLVGVIGKEDVLRTVAKGRRAHRYLE